MFLDFPPFHKQLCGAEMHVWLPLVVENCNYCDTDQQANGKYSMFLLTKKLYENLFAEWRVVLSLYR